MKLRLKFCVVDYKSYKYLVKHLWRGIRPSGT